MLLLAAAAAHARQATPAEWRDCLSPPVPAVSAADGSGRASSAGGVLVVRAPKGDRAVAPLAASCPAAFDLHVELRWDLLPGSATGGAELLVGPHAFGSSGYRIMVQARPWQAAECRAPRLERGAWHSLDVRVRPGWIEFWLADRLAVRCPTGGNGADDVHLAVAPGAEATVRRCRIRAGQAAGPVHAPPLLVCPAAAFPFDGRRVPDGDAAGGEAVEMRGAGRGKWLLRGQDLAPGRAAAWDAVFGLRGVDGSGRVWLEVATPEGQVLASRSMSLEELPADGYARLRLPFRSEADSLVEFRVAAERGRLRVDQVAVEGARADGAPPPDAAADPAGGPARQPRRALPLKDVWGKEPKAAVVPLAIVRLERRLAEGGWYEFRAVWSQGAAEPLANVAVDLWVACRDEWGIVRVFDHAAAYQAVPRGAHETAAGLDPALIPRYGSPGAFFAVVYHRGAPVAAAWRKWGIPVDDKYIVAAPRAGSLRDK